MHAIVTDIRHALRRLARSPAFTAVAVGVLALGIGAATAIFSVVDHILFRPLDLPDAERVVTLCETHETVGGWCGASPPTMEDWRAEAATLEAAGLARSRSFTLRTEEGGVGLSGGIATPGFFRALGIETRIGRPLADDDLPPEAPGNVVVLGHGAWTDHFGADPEVVGRTVTLDDRPYTVIGVLPAGTRVPRLDWVQLWTPLPFDPRDEANRDWRGFVTAARLAPDATRRQAREELARLHTGLAGEHPEAMEGWGVDVRGMREYLVGSARPTLLVFLGAVGVVLLIVCVNMAGLLLARATGREREVAVRAALGADRGDLVRHLLAESGLLALAGGVGGVLVALWGTRAFVALAPPGIPRIDEVAVDGPVLAFGLATALLSGLLFGLLPALRAGAVDPRATLAAGRNPTSERGSQRIRRALVVGEVALALVLIVGAGLLVRSFATLTEWEPGFETEDLVTFQAFASDGRYPEAGDVAALWRRAEAAFAARPAVASAATASAGPLFGGGDGSTPFLVEGRGGRVQEAPAVNWYDVGPGYFETLGVPVVEGRGIAETDDAGAPSVAVVNRTMARRFWPEGSPIGARLVLPRIETSFTGEDPPPLSVRIVGVVADTRPFYPGEPTPPEIYWSNRQRPRWATYFVLRTEGSPGAVAGRVEDVLAGVDPDLQPYRLRTMGELVGDRLVRPRFDMFLVGMLAGVALVLGLVGVYGVIAYTVEMRAPELGVRMALGARREQILAGVLRDGMGLIALGVAVGLVGALAAVRLLSGMLHGIRPTDPATYVVTAGLLVAAGAAAVLVPALRAARTDPARVLQEQ